MTVVDHPLTGAPPEWACAWGEDAHGVWVGLEIAGVVQRMRWIPPGDFVMGSPSDEPGRFENEGPPHEVRLTRGLWLGETPVIQELWMAVMRSNPSRFDDPRRPVEQVSWDDVQSFLHAAGVDGLRLPTEAEWEYACRADTTTATFAGPIEILGANNAPVLDRIAWYGGNSGVGFELKRGYDTSDWPEKHHPHERAGTHPVGEKDPNPWGLRDMLGNVWEWCADRVERVSAGDIEDAAPYESAVTLVDPVGTRGADRVIRGGSWYADARGGRAACRNAGHPSYRDDDVGLRLARGQPGEDKAEAGGERGAGRRRTEVRDEPESPPPAARGASEEDA